MALVVKSNVKKFCRGMRCSKDFYNALDRKVEDILREAIDRARGNKRATLRPVDL